MSFGGVKKLKWLTAPRLPYYTSPDSLFYKGEGPLIEVPLTALFFPYVGTTMRIFPYLTSIQRRIINFESAYLNGKPVVFDIHPNEFIDESNEQRIIHNRSKNKLSYFVQDWLRAQLKTKNLGMKCKPYFEKEIEFYKKRDYEFLTVKEYCIKNGFIK